MDDSNHRIPFAFDEESKIFQKNISAYIQAIVTNMREQFLPSENTSRFSHGVNWQLHNSDSPGEVSALKAHETRAELKHADLIDGKPQKLAILCFEMAKGMHEATMRSLYQMLSETTNRTGNVVSVGQGRNAEAFLEMLKKVEFGVDKKGNPIVPQIHTSPQMAAILEKDLSTQGPDFKEQVERIKSEKMSQAQDRETARRARFVRKND